MKKTGLYLLVVFSFGLFWPFNTFATDSLTNLERAFLLNQASLMKNLLPKNEYLSISFSAPLSISDNFSFDQSYLIFKRIFSQFKTLEFYSIQFFPLPHQEAAILKARWSFQDRQTNKKYAINAYFFLKTSLDFSPSENISFENMPWIIQEIKGIHR